MYNTSEGEHVHNDRKVSDVDRLLWGSSNSVLYSNPLRRKHISINNSSGFNRSFYHTLVGYSIRSLALNYSISTSPLFPYRTHNGRFNKHHRLMSPTTCPLSNSSENKSKAQPFETGISNDSRPKPSPQVSSAQVTDKNIISKVRDAIIAAGKAAWNYVTQCVAEPKISHHISSLSPDRLDPTVYKSCMSNKQPTFRIPDEDAHTGTLNKEQRLVVESVLSGYSTFFTGPAGSGDADFLFSMF